MSAVTAPEWVDRSIVEYLERVVALYGTHDLERLGEELITSDCAFIDHRPLGGDPIIGRAAVGKWLTEVFALLPDWQLAIEVLDQRGDVYLARDTYSGHDDRGGEAMLEWFVVDRL